MQTELEYILTNSYKDGMISFLTTNPEHFDEAISLAIIDKQPYSWRAAWILWSCMVENDIRIQAHIKNLISAIESKKDGQKRELLKILLMMEIDEENEGVLFNICIGIWENILYKPALRFTAFMVILKIAKKYPDLKTEIKFYTQNQYIETLSGGIRNSINKHIKKYKL